MTTPFSWLDEVRRRCSATTRAGADAFTDNGHTAEHVADNGMRNAEDSPIWDYALAQGAAIVTKDEDFRHRLSQSTIAPAIVWLRVGNTSRRALLDWFEPLLPQIEAQLGQGERLVEVR